ncbi:hypothetical protein H257_00176 [Aphanomyces astaci]|uniref:Uncharacterized protein n=1 Tax=Aphanomyces astaci TaxID=112090 RepID=W4H9P0_APHAT|nr:hypothetical protein H257_00176 [Aphanomyces astaci]ETV88632.1 hypothetical protein H257_00176 [Aphanomyces astaci]|eukprot:XP_009821032.1 hypothetical protein H257_00176 [Aphanomyces astaci]
MGAMATTTSSRRGRTPAAPPALPPSNEEMDIDDLAAFPYGLAWNDQIEHYMPPNFPLLPQLTPSRIALCRRSWAQLHAASTPAMKPYDRPGIVLVYEEFFYRLVQRDTTITRVFPTAKKQGEVLISAIQFILSSNADTPQDVAAVASRSRFLGHRHRSFPNVRPHHFAMYTSTCVEVIMFWLGDMASPDIGAAWSNTAGFVLKHLLEPFLYERTDPYECYQNITVSATRKVEETRIHNFSDTASSSTYTKTRPGMKSTSAWKALRNSTAPKHTTKMPRIAVTSLMMNEARKARGATVSSPNNTSSIP